MSWTYQQLRAVYGPPPRRLAEPCRVGAIQAAVAHYYDISVRTMLAKDNRPEIVHPRHVAMFLARSITGKYLTALGKLFGGRDHTTVLSAIRKIERQLVSDPVLADDVKRLREYLEAAQ